MFEVTGLRAWYGAVQAIRDASFVLLPGEVLAIVGPNGAGKSTLAYALTGVHQRRTGTVRLDGADLSRAGAVATSRAGLTLAPQGRRLFGSCTVAEHFTLAAGHARPGAMAPAELLELFPRLRERWRVRARSLSGGEQQMLSISRAVLPGPSVVMLDEPTEGLAPSIVTAVSALIGRLRARGVATLLMEQHGGFPFRVADRVVALERGVLRADPPGQPATRPDPGASDPRAPSQQGERRSA